MNDIGWYACVVDGDMECVLWYNGENYFKWFNHDTGACRDMVDLHSIELICKLTPGM